MQVVTEISLKAIPPPSLTVAKYGGWYPPDEHRVDEADAVLWVFKNFV